MNEEQFQVLKESLEKKMEQLFHLKFNNRDRMGGLELAMEITGYKESSIYKKVELKEIPFYKQKRKLRFSEKALIAYMQEKELGGRLANSEEKEIHLQPRRRGGQYVIGRN
jgi:predicted DNA-binding transcriptional regulator AlpA